MGIDAHGTYTAGDPGSDPALQQATDDIDILGELDEQHELAASGVVLVDEAVGGLMVEFHAVFCVHEPDQCRGVAGCGRAEVDFFDGSAVHERSYERSRRVTW